MSAPPQSEAVPEDAVRRYPDNQFEKHERVSFDNANYIMGGNVVDPSSEMHRPCRHTFRPKYTCTSCRRVYKMHIHPDNEYYCETFSNKYYWRRKPDRAKTLSVYRSIKKEDPEKAAKLELLLNGPQDFTVFTPEELEELEGVSSWIWKPLENLRCPGCGEPGQLVGTTFRAPPADDERGWQKVKELLDQGEKFLPCPSVKEYENMLLEGQRGRIRAMQGAEWQQEKARRIAEFTTGFEMRPTIDSSAGNP